MSVDPTRITPVREASQDIEEARVDPAVLEATGSEAPGDGVPVRPDLGPPGAGVQPVDQPGSGLGLIVSVIVSAIVFVLAILATGQATPNRTPMLQTTTIWFWVVAGIVIVGAGFGAEYAERAASHGFAAGSRRSASLPTAWIVPAVATAAAVMLVATFHNTLMMVVGPLAAFLGNAGALLSRDLLDDATDSSQHTATVIHTIVVHAVAFLGLSAIYLNKLPTPAAVPLVVIFGGLLLLETLERSVAERPRRLIYATVGAIFLGQATIALNWWLTHGWTGGAVLLVCFYVAAGVLLAVSQRSAVRLRDLMEFGLVGLVALVVLAITA